MNWRTKLNIKIYDLINGLIPKKNQLLVNGGDRADSNAIEAANYISEHCDFPVYFMVNDFFEPYADSVLSEKVHKIRENSFQLKIIRLRTKWLMGTHDSLLRPLPKNQTYINLWHGVGHKSKGIKENHLKSDITIATSEMVKNMFADLMHIPEESLIITGYPRNDLMLRAQNEKQKWLNKFAPDLSAYDKVLIWMPTFQRTEGMVFNYGSNPIGLGDFFHLPDFDTAGFDSLLKKHNAICLLKPHPIYNIDNFDSDRFDNIRIIDDRQIFKSGMTLYHLLGCTDLLITDYSSVMTDYTLLRKPVLLFAPNFEEYKDKHGFYFENVEDWMPSKLLFTQTEFFEYIRTILTTGLDPCEEKRERICNLYFSDRDTKSAERLAEYVSNYKMKTKIDLFWYRHKAGHGNFGDALNPYIIEKLTDKKVRFSDIYLYGLSPVIFIKTLTHQLLNGNVSLSDYIRYISGYFIKKPKILVAIGSVLQRVKSENIIVWGSGIIMWDVTKFANAQFLAVRGKKTVEKIKEFGYRAPDVIGDPALLLPLVCEIKVEKKYKIGLIPHFMHHSEIEENLNNPDILLINILDPIEKIINEINSCDFTFSTSLHGIIVSHAYQIPSLWVTNYSHCLDGDDIKYWDYFSAVDIENYKPVDLKTILNSDTESLLKIFESFKPKDCLPSFEIIQTVQKNLLKVFPFELTDKYQKLIK